MVEVVTIHQNMVVVMKHIKQWLSKPIYEVLPFVFLSAAIAFLQITDSILVTLFAICLIVYSLYILAWRVMARDSILVDCFNRQLST